MAAPQCRILLLSSAWVHTRADSSAPAGPCRSSEASSPLGCSAANPWIHSDPGLPPSAPARGLSAEPRVVRDVFIDFTTSKNSSRPEAASTAHMLTRSQGRSRNKSNGPSVTQVAGGRESFAVHSPPIRLWSWLFVLQSSMTLVCALQPRLSLHSPDRRAVELAPQGGHCPPLGEDPGAIDALFGFCLLLALAEVRCSRRLSWSWRNGQV